MPTLDLHLKVTTLGSTEVSAGCLSGDIELSGFEQNKIEITCHASGTTVKDERITGYAKPELAFTLQETDKVSLQKFWLCTECQYLPSWRR